MANGYGKWRASVWRRLLEEILRVEQRLPKRPPFTFGGGSALAVDLTHRVSYDIDLFYTNAEALDLFNPNRNADVRALVEARGGSWQDPGNYLKLELGPETGEIDILISRSLTKDPALEWAFGSWRIRRERPREIVAKKIRYRASQFKRRDIFDLAAVIDKSPREIAPAFDAVADKLPLLRDRIDTMRDDFRRNVAADVNTTRAYRYLFDDAPDICVRCLDGWLRRMKSSRPKPRLS